MRTAYRIFACMSIIAVIFQLCITIVLWSSLQPNANDITLATLNWPFIQPSLLISGFVLLVGGVGVFTCGTDKDVWKSQNEYFELLDELRDEKIVIFELRKKLSDAIIKNQK